MSIDDKITVEQVKNFKREIELTKLIVDYAAWAYQRTIRNKEGCFFSVKNAVFYTKIIDNYLNLPFQSSNLPVDYQNVNYVLEDE